MVHSYELIFAGFKIRPAKIVDSRFILELRTNPSINRFIGDTSAKIDDQLQWMRSYEKRQGDYYFVIENIKNSKAVGTIGLYDIQNNQAEWGRWVITPGVPAAAASAYLIYALSFDVLNLNMVFCRTVEDNKSVLSIHDSYGAERSHLELSGVQIKDVKYNFVVHQVTKANYLHVKMRLEKYALMAERLL